MKLLKPIVFFDLETTGVNTSTDKIVQIAVIKINTDGSREEKEMLIDPQMPIPPSATEVHGITDEMVQGKPTFKQVSKGIKDFFYGSDIAGYNSDNFDVPILMQEFHRCQIEFPDWELNFVDVLKVERLLNSHKLTDAFKRYTGKDLDDAHEALADTRATEAVFMDQLKRLNEDDSLTEDHTPESIDKLCQGENIRFDYAGKCYIKDGVVFWSFGKNKDNPVLEDPGYLNWVLNSDFPIETKNKLKSLLTQK